ncbi:hypothetical protein GCM10022246_10400 [Pedobacter ginsengiterrae]|uniref:Uncharacterized protein n=1 Tax=Pedobacter ginsengiterrae TaxID=871696 RepID=A0ABP7P3S9_9SPHI
MLIEDNLAYSSFILTTNGCMPFISLSDLLPKTFAKNPNIIFYSYLLFKKTGVLQQPSHALLQVILAVNGINGVKILLQDFL